MMKVVESAVILRKLVQWRTRWMARRTGYGVGKDLVTWMYRKFELSLRSMVLYRR